MGVLSTRSKNDTVASRKPRMEILNTYLVTVKIKRARKYINFIGTAAAARHISDLQRVNQNSNVLFGLFLSIQIGFAREKPESFNHQSTYQKEVSVDPCYS